MTRRSLLLVASSASAFAAPPKKLDELDPNLHVRIHYCYINRIRYTFAVSRARYEKLPKWTPFEGTPVPVLPKVAYDLARKHLDSITVPSDYDWELSRISLEPLGGMDADSRWLYVVSFRYYYRAGSSGPQTHMDYLITLDGQFIEPLEQPKPH